MTKTIIALYGTANVGKSMTLSRLGRQLQNAGGRTADNITAGEYRAVFTYQGTVIGVQTFGDSDLVVSSGLSHFQNNNCDIICIACKRFGATTDRITAFARTNGYRLVWTAPFEVWDGSIINDDLKTYCASHLLLVIDDVVKGAI